MPMPRLLAAALALGLLAGAAQAETIIVCDKQGCSDRPAPAARADVSHRRHVRLFVPRGMIKVSTAAGIDVVVAPAFAPKIKGFIAGLVARGYRPRRIHCWAPRGTHVRRSLHYPGKACDFDQRGWNKTARTMYRIGALAAKWGLRDGCSFRRSDCGHIDAGRPVRPMVARR
jgi:hypothetical protein